MIKLLNKDRWITLNKNLITIIGLEGAAIVGELVSKYDYFYKKNMLDKDGGFFWTCKEIDEMFNIKRRKREKTLNMLEELGIFKRERRSFSNKTHFYINEQALEDLVLLDCVQRVPRDSTQRTVPYTNNNTNNKNSIDNSLENSTEVKKVDKDCGSKDHKDTRDEAIECPYTGHYYTR